MLFAPKKEICARGRVPVSVRFREWALSGLREHSENPRRIDDESFEAVQRSLEASPEMLRARIEVAVEVLYFLVSCIEHEPSCALCHQIKILHIFVSFLLGYVHWDLRFVFQMFHI